MRPLELTVDGFRSYRTPQTFDLRGRRLVGIVGEIGAGKSSILDAIAFALYGKTPTIGRETKSLIHQLRDDCHVQLRFRVDGQVWQIQRSLRRRSRFSATASCMPNPRPYTIRFSALFRASWWPRYTLRTIGSMSLAPRARS